MGVEGGGSWVGGLLVLHVLVGVGAQVGQAGAGWQGETEGRGMMRIVGCSMRVGGWGKEGGREGRERHTRCLIL